ncbi:hypothetical protein HN51_035132 [Arachis hypogaea]|uniref:Ubiquitin-like domain-containing protein n=1 Tax=Arachis hypogaea TaxID=3818 RepID=A0A445A5Y8_ARAHY|nr:uncharacterized protein DS421_13g403680 [Arachis hypogaea]RYR21775.1 hypothetical protein Ahy_B03g067093 [Arachis hypogaea]
MKVVVENLTGTLFYIQVKNDATIHDLKREIEAQQKLPFERLILVVDADHTPLMSKEEEERVSLAEYGVQDGSHVYLFLNPVDDNNNNNNNNNHPTDQVIFNLPDVFISQTN